MRLIITLKGSDHSLPINYRHLIQGWIYSSLPKNGFNTFLHDYGYQSDGKKFKLFVFSDLLGKYHVENQTISFEDRAVLEIASQSPEFIGFLYRKLIQEQKMKLGKADFFLKELKIQNDIHFVGEKTVTLETISPVTAYRFSTRFDYFSPDQEDFEDICRQNLMRKAYLANPAMKGDPVFQFIEIIQSTKKLAHFKSTFYEAYTLRFKARVDSFSLNLLLNTGLSSKSSAGFGMLRLVKL